MVDEARLRSTTDAQVWTEEFLTVVPDADPGLMLGWFANAIEAGALREAARYEQVGWWVERESQAGTAMYVFKVHIEGRTDIPADAVPLYRQVTEGSGS